MSLHVKTQLLALKTKVHSLYSQANIKQHFHISKKIKTIGETNHTLKNHSFQSTHALFT